MMQKPNITLDTALKSDNRVSLSLPAQQLVPSPELDLVKPALLAFPQDRHTMR